MINACLTVRERERGWYKTVIFEKFPTRRQLKFCGPNIPFLLSTSATTHKLQGREHRRKIVKNISNKWNSLWSDRKQESASNQPMHSSAEQSLIRKKQPVLLSCKYISQILVVIWYIFHHQASSRSPLNTFHRQYLKPNNHTFYLALDFLFDLNDEDTIRHFLKFSYMNLMISWELN